MSRVGYYDVISDQIRMQRSMQKAGGVGDRGAGIAGVEVKDDGMVTSFGYVCEERT